VADPEILKAGGGRIIPISARHTLPQTHAFYTGKGDLLKTILRPIRGAPPPLPLNPPLLQVIFLEPHNRRLPLSLRRAIIAALFKIVFILSQNLHFIFFSGTDLTSQVRRSI